MWNVLRKQFQPFTNISLLPSCCVSKIVVLGLQNGLTVFILVCHVWDFNSLFALWPSCHMITVAQKPLIHVMLQRSGKQVKAFMFYIWPESRHYSTWQHIMNCLRRQLSSDSFTSSLHFPVHPLWASQDSDSEWGRSEVLTLWTFEEEGKHMWKSQASIK